MSVPGARGFTLLVLLSLFSVRPGLAQTTDSDGDGLPDAWETQFGLSAASPDGGDGAAGDPDGDGVNNLAEYQNGTDPILPNVWYLAEGATGFFGERIAIANPRDDSATFSVTFLTEGGGAPITETYTLAGQRRMTVAVNDVPGLSSAAVSATVTVTRGGVVVERTMMWNNQDGSQYGGHTGKAVQRPRTTWYLAEGEASFFDTYILLANSNSSAASATLTFQLESGSPIVHTRTVPANSRVTVYANDVPGLRGKAFSTTITSTIPIIAERAMYFGNMTRLFNGGHESAAVEAPATSWFVAEGRTGSFFDMYLLLANPNTAAAAVTVRFLKPGGSVVTETRTLAPQSRATIHVDSVSGLADTDVSASITSDRPIIVERAMYWPDPFTSWYEAHNSSGVTATGTKWALAEGEVGGPLGCETYIALANPGSASATVTLTFLRTSASPVTLTRTVGGNARVTVSAGEAGLASGEKFGVRIDSTQPIAVERSLYWNGGGQFWGAGTNETAILLAPAASGVFGVTGLSTTAPAALAALELTTVALDPTVPVTVSYSNAAGFSAVFTGVHVRPDGTVVAPVPLYVDPATGTIGSGTVDVVISQSQPGALTVASKPVSVVIQDLPPLASLGLTRGQVTQAYLTFSLLLASDALTSLEYLANTTAQVDTAAARSALLEHIRKLRLARADVQRMAADPSAVTTIAGIQFGSADLELLDKLVAVWITRLPVDGSAANAASACPVTEAMSCAPASTAADIPKVIEFLTDLAEAPGIWKRWQKLTETNEADLLTVADSLLFFLKVKDGVVSSPVSKSLSVGLAGTLFMKDLALVDWHLHTVLYNGIAGRDTTADWNAVKLHSKAATQTGAKFAAEVLTHPVLGPMAAAALGVPATVAAPAGALLLLGGTLYQLHQDGTLDRINDAMVRAFDAASLHDPSLLFGVTAYGAFHYDGVPGALYQIQTNNHPGSVQVTTWADGKGNYAIPIATRTSRTRPTKVALQIKDASDTLLAARSVTISSVADGASISAGTTTSGLFCGQDYSYCFEQWKTWSYPCSQPRSVHGFPSTVACFDAQDVKLKACAAACP